jgi:hypothetical protein
MSGHWSFLISSSGTLSMLSDVNIEIGDPVNNERSSSLRPRLRVSSPPLVGVDRPDRAVVSVISFRNASNSRSNLKEIPVRREEMGGL